MSPVGDAIITARRARAARQPAPPLPIDACIELYTEPGQTSKIRMLKVLSLLFDHPPEVIAKALKDQGIRIRRQDREVLRTRQEQDLQRQQPKDRKHTIKIQRHSKN
jgi:hypothetical protein